MTLPETGYATVEDFKRRYSQDEVLRLSNQGDARIQAANDERIAIALKSAFGEILSYQNVVGDVPPYTPNQRFNEIQLTIARKSLSTYRDENDPRYRDYRDVIRWLELYAAGKVVVTPPQAGNGQTPPPIAPVPDNSIDWEPGSSWDLRH
jgi:phage gp36-like protein